MVHSGGIPAGNYKWYSQLNMDGEKACEQEKNAQ